MPGEENLNHGTTVLVMVLITNPHRLWEMITSASLHMCTLDIGEEARAKAALQ